MSHLRQCQKSVKRNIRLNLCKKHNTKEFKSLILAMAMAIDRSTVLSKSVSFGSLYRIVKLTFYVLSFSTVRCRFLLGNLLFFPMCKDELILTWLENATYLNDLKLFLQKLILSIGY